MLRREYNNTTHTIEQINNAVEYIANTEKADYKLHGYNPDSVMLLCRTGYNWSIVTEVMWDKADDQHLDLLIECRNVNSSASAAQVQHEYEEKHLDKICELFFKHINAPAAPIKKENARSGWVVAVVLGVVAIITIAVFFIFKTMNK